jgi:hypothetical protein
MASTKQKRAKVQLTKKQRRDERLHTCKVNDALIAEGGSCHPILVDGVTFFNRRQLLLLGITPEDYDTYFRLTAVKVIANGGNINLLTRVSDYQEFVRFTDIQAKLFTKKN